MARKPRPPAQDRKSEGTEADDRLTPPQDQTTGAEAETGPRATREDIASEGAGDRAAHPAGGATDEATAQTAPAAPAGEDLPPPEAAEEQPEQAGATGKTPSPDTTEPTDTPAAPDEAPSPDEPAQVPDTAPADTVADRRTPPGPRGPGVLALVGGGVLAAVIGFGAARFVIPEGWPFGPVSQATRDLTAALDRQAERLDTLRADLDALPGSIAQTTTQTATETMQQQIAALRDDLSARIGALETDLAALRDTIEPVGARLSALERQPAGGGAASEAAIRSFEAELASLRKMLEEERARHAAAEAEVEEKARQMRESAAALARKTAIDAARADLARALDSGGGYGDALAQLEDQGVAIPDALRAHADTGVATLKALQRDFVPPARAALRATAGGTTGDIGAFLREQFGVRSLSPREGDSPDAILSRAEAALDAGDLATALAELDTLPEAGLAAMADWIRAAKARKSVIEAAPAVNIE